ncbi:MAG: HAMP domain-containing histidine kinase [Hyphomicrobiales bacterium]|nr:HAMP domain-containing histidine kinase [Hyphomicrobiales bacterium]MCO5084950.1 HAMP domain-containing histidine kinase [Rhizobiaceae bacterium]
MNAPDKTIVDRSKPHRNSEVAKAVRKTREQLSQKAGNPVFDRELIKIHARSVMNGAGVLPLLVIVVAAGGMLSGVKDQIVIWGLLSLACYAFLIVVAHRIDRMEVASIDAAATRRLFLAAHFVSGLGWAYLTVIACNTCQVELFPVVKAAILIMAIAATALISSSMPGALAVTFSLPVAIYTVFTSHFAVLPEAMMAIILILSVPFFSYASALLSRSSRMLLTFRSENDGLIAELETAKAVSDEARRRAEESNLAKSRFLATMSHELRTPLNAILGFSEVIAKEVLGPINNATYREYAQDIHDSGKHLLGLINEILDLSRIEAGKYQLNEEPLSLVPIVEDCCHMMELRAGNKNLTIRTEFEPTLARIFADERAVRQIALNLLSNAVKFSPSGGEILVRVGWTEGAGQYISVSDHGPGIPPEEIPVVLSAFGQGSIAIKAAEQGTGLGLPIVQGLLAMHGGDFILDSKLRVGTDAIAIFPASRVMEELPAIPREASGRNSRPRRSMAVAS